MRIAGNGYSVLKHIEVKKSSPICQRCTHSGVLVQYDPTTHHLVCPAHGAIFDPAEAGKVLQGPALQPLPTVGIRVEADGTISVL